MRGFKITGNRGFHITFSNGVTVSVQFGPYSYCGDYYSRLISGGSILDSEMRAPAMCQDAEVAVFDTLRKTTHVDGWESSMWITRAYAPEEYSDVLGYQSPEDVLKIFNWAAGLTREWLDAYEPSVPDSYRTDEDEE